MEFFETPSWDGAHGTEKLENELFRSLSFPTVTVSKKRKNRKRNKYPKGLLVEGDSEKSASPKSVKDKSTKVKNTDALKKNKILRPHAGCQFNNEKQKGKGLHKKIKEAQSSLSLSSQIKLKKKKEHTEIECVIKSLKNDHDLKPEKNNVIVSGKLKSHKKKSTKGNKTPDIEHQHNSGSYLMKTQESAGSLVRKPRNNTPVNAICSHADQKVLKKKNSKMSPVKKVKTNTMEAANTVSRPVIQSKSNQPSVSESLDDQSKSPVSQEKVLSGSGETKKVKKKKKKKKKDAGYSCKNSDASIADSSSRLMVNSSAVVGKKRKHPEHNETGATKVKKLSKNSDTQLDFTCSAKKIQHSNINVQSHTREPEVLVRPKKTIPVQDKGVVTGSKKKLTLREKMMEKLSGARFRFLNEQMYSSKSEETGKFFQTEPESFEAYHEGYKQQLSQWPLKPVDVIIKYLKKKPTNCIIADFGCGDAQIAQSLPNRVHSFDHVALNDHVTVCDMAHTPLSNGSVDVAVFCLSLMGSNLSDYICEANRVLKIGGILKIAEVESRFDDVERFIKVVCKFGFLCIRRDLSKDVFYLFDFKKEKNLQEWRRLPAIELKPCFYKKR